MSIAIGDKRKRTEGSLRVRHSRDGAPQHKRHGWAAGNGRRHAQMGSLARHRDGDFRRRLMISQRSVGTDE
jgi:hypothetical protein